MIEIILAAKDDQSLPIDATKWTYTAVAQNKWAPEVIAFGLVICQLLGIDPYEYDEKYKAFLKQIYSIQYEQTQEFWTDWMENYNKNVKARKNDPK